MTTGSLAIKVALVTGAGKGIGRAISIALAGEGAQLVLAGRDIAGLEETARLIGESNNQAPAALICQMDLLDAKSIESTVGQTLNTFGRIDVLVNNSGIAGKNSPLWELSEAEWDETMDINLKGSFLVSKAVVPTMVSQKSGSVIFIGSITGKRPLANRSVYAASKLGMVGLMRTLALELAPHGVRVNLVSPGYVGGPRLDSVIEKVAESEGLTPKQVHAKWLAMVPTGEYVTPEQIAQGVLFFASDRSKGITGDDLNINGGLVMY
jgi:NAD(P)-dependent dehydrogenase (short-subunit alcohol dehydrogenase family)